MEKPTIFIVEDEAIVANDIKETLKSLGYEVTGIAKSGEIALEKIGILMPDLVLMDIHLATQMDGVETAGKIHGLYGIPVIYLTAYADKALLDRAKITEPYGYILKPYEERELHSAIEIALYKHTIECKLKESEQLIHTLIDAIGDPIFMIDQETRVLIMNTVFMHTHTIEPGTGAGQNLDTLAGSGYISKKLVEMIRDHFSDRQPFQFEEEFNGVWLDQRISPLLNLDGDVTRCVVHSHDISKIKKAEEALTISNERLEKEKLKLFLYGAIVEEMHDNVVVTDSGGYIFMVNTSFQRHFGYTMEELMHKHISFLQAPEDPSYLKVERFTEDRKTVWNMNIVALNKNKIKLKMSLKSTPIVHENQPLYRVFVLRERQI